MVRAAARRAQARGARPAAPAPAAGAPHLPHQALAEGDDKGAEQEAGGRDGVEELLLVGGQHPEDAAAGQGGREGGSRSVGRGIGIGSSRLPHASQPLRPLSPSSPCPSVPSRYTSC